MKPYDHLYIYEMAGRVGDVPISSPDYIGCWSEGDSSFLFFHKDRRALVERLIEQGDLPRLVDAYDMDYEQWQGDKLKAFRVGSLWFRPPYGDIPSPPEGCREVPFDPGVVFGTGLHPTTVDCLHLITDLFRTHIPKEVLDLGTGTGILAIACALLGAKRVTAVDINRLSVMTAARNVELNGLTDKIDVMEGDAREMLRRGADLAVMNIHFSVLDELTNRDEFYQKRWIILSGVLRSDYYILLKRLQKRVRLVKERQTGHWFSAWFET